MLERLLKPRNSVLVFISLLFMFRLFIIGGIPLSPDEAYYWAWSRRLSVCYYDQPGMVAWVDWLFSLPWERTTAFTLRLGAAVMSAIGTWLLYLLYREYRRDDREASVFAMGFSVLPFTWLAGMLMIHDSVLFPWLVFTYWMMVRLVKFDGRVRDWLLLAVALAGALYAKFSAGMVVWGLLLYMVVSPRGRRWWRTWPPYAGGLLGAALFSPVVLWNFQHDWISLHALSELTRVEGLELSGRLRYFIEYVLSQPGMFSGLLGISAFWALFRASRHAFRHPAEDMTVLLVCLALPVFFYFLQQSFRSHVFGNWPAVAYLPVGMLAMREVGAAWREGKRGGAFGTRFVTAGMAVNLVIVLGGTLHLRHDLMRPLFSVVEERFGLEDRIDWRVDQDFRGWDAMAALVEEARPGADFIMARRYQVASMLELELPGQPFVQCYNQGQRGNQWDLWSRLDELSGATALYVDYKRMKPEVMSRFEAVEPVFAPFVLGDPERPIKEWYIYMGSGWKGPQ